jgi:predicted nucleotidyltransferase
VRRDRGKAPIIGRIGPVIVTPDLERDDRALVDLLRNAVDGLIAVYRFGSTAEGVSHPASDTDVAVLARAPIPAVARFEIQEHLASRLGRDVDLVVLTAASPVMAIQVVARGRLLYDGDSDARGRFEDLTFGTYARLNEERRGILERVAAEGTVYGR